MRIVNESRNQNPNRFVPMTPRLLAASRRAFYHAQNGSKSLTVRQLRAIRTADKRAVARAAALLAGAR